MYGLRKEIYIVCYLTLTLINMRLKTGDEASKVKYDIC